MVVRIDPFDQFSVRLFGTLRVITECLFDGGEPFIDLDQFSDELWPGREEEVCAFLAQRATAIAAPMFGIWGPVTITQFSPQTMLATTRAEETFALSAVLTTSAATTTFLLSPKVGLCQEKQANQ